jgi:hypothetical protein
LQVGSVYPLEIYKKLKTYKNYSIYEIYQDSVVGNDHIALDNPLGSAR